MLNFVLPLKVEWINDFIVSLLQSLNYHKNNEIVVLGINRITCALIGYQKGSLPDHYYNNMQNTNAIKCVLTPQIWHQLQFQKLFHVKSLNLELIINFSNSYFWNFHYSLYSLLY